MKETKVFIVGSGPSGITAAIYLKRAGIPFILCEKSMVGGKVALTAKVDNYPGFTSIDGVELALNLQEQLKQNEIKVTYDTIQSIHKENELFYLEGNKDQYIAKYVILATGTKEKGLGLDNEEKFYGKGISFCAICDGALYKNKDVALVGGGNSALEEALYLANIVNKVYLIHRRDEFRGDLTLVNKVKDKDNIILYTPYIINKLSGTNHLEEIQIVSNEEVESLSVSALFIYIGYIPTLEMLKEDILLDNGYAVVDENMMTSLPNLYAIGDVRKKNLRQIVTAINDGAIASYAIGKRENE